MARKKGGLNPEVQDDGGLFGDQMLVYEDDLKKAEETPARKKSAGGRVAKASAEAPVQTPLLPEVEESVEVQADEPVQETAPEESPAARHHHHAQPARSHVPSRTRRGRDGGGSH